MKKVNLKSAVLRMSGIMAFAIGFAAFTACSDDDKEPIVTGDYPEFKDMAAQTEAHTAGSTVTLRFFAPGVWNLESRTNWLVVPDDKATGTAGDQTVTVSITDANRGFEDQEGTLAYRVNGQEYSYTITRKAADMTITVNGGNPEEAQIVLTELNGGFRAIVDVTANFNWIADYPDWILPDKLDDRGYWRGSSDEETSNTLYADVSKVDSEGTEGFIRFYYADGTEIDETRYFEVPVSTTELEDTYFYWDIEYSFPNFSKDGYIIGQEGSTTDQTSYWAKVVSIDPGYKIMAIESYEEWGIKFFRIADWVNIEKVQTRAAINSDNYIISVGVNNDDSRSADLFFFPANVKINDVNDDIYDWQNDFELYPELEPYFSGEISQLGGLLGLAFDPYSYVTGEIIDLIATGEVNVDTYGTDQVYKVIYPSTNDNNQSMTLIMPDLPVEDFETNYGYFGPQVVDYTFEPSSELNISNVITGDFFYPYSQLMVRLNTNNSGITRKITTKLVQKSMDDDEEEEEDPYLYAVVIIEQPSN